VDVFHISTNTTQGVVAQTPVLTQVEVLGVNPDLSHAFDQDILTKPIKH
jgi:hypothetical protein